MSREQIIEFQKLMNHILPEVKARMAELALLYGNFGGGGSIGFKNSENGDIYPINFEINKDLPARSKEKPWTRYAGYAALKVHTALTNEKDTENEPEKTGCAESKHEGGCVHQICDVWISVGYSGLAADEDREIGYAILNEFFNMPIETLM